MGKIMLIDTAPVIGDDKCDIVTWHLTAMAISAVIFRNTHPPALHGDPAAINHGITGVYAEIEEDLVDLDRIDLDQRTLAGRNPDKRDMLTNQSP